jgi:hypothetical protein
LTSNKKFNAGDLVQFDIVRKYGVVVETKAAAGFLPEEGIDDIRVLWEDNETFWCLDFTLEHVY